MHLYTAGIEWRRGAGEAFVDDRYARAHRWRFDGGVDLPASSSPQIVPVPLSEPRAVDPEEAFVASLASCHLLWFLSLAAAAGYVVDAYVDRAEGTLARNAEGRLAMTLVTLRPRVRFAAASVPDAQAFARLHENAHEACFIANSVRTEVRCEATLDHQETP